MKCSAGSPYPFRYTKRVERYSQRTRLTRVFLMRNVLAVLDLLGVILDLDPCRDHGRWKSQKHHFLLLRVLLFTTSDSYRVQQGKNG